MRRTKGSLAWMLEAACLDEDPELFFPPGKSKQAAEQAEEARAVCHGCDVRGPCLELGLQTNAQFGIWGGFSPLELARIRRRSPFDRISARA